MRCQFFALSMLACLAAAAPQPNKVFSKVMTYTTTVVSTQTTAPTPVNLTPIVHPSVDTADLSNLKATKDATLHYAEKDNNLKTSQQLASVFSNSTEFPLVQLENTDFVKSISCSDSSATVVFTSKKAYTVAASDWKMHPQFIIVSYDAACGSGHDSSKRDFMIAKVVTLSPSSLTIKTSVTFVDFAHAFGEQTEVSVEVGKYTAPMPRRRSPFSFSSLDPTVEKSVSTGPFDWNEYPTNQITVDAWGGASGYQIYSDATTTVACIGCGTDGEITVSGSFKWKLLEFKVTQATVSVAGHMEATINLGIAAQISKSFPVEDAILASVPLSPLTILDIITIGPVLTVTAGASIDLSAQGSLLVGATLAWPSLSASGDAISGTTSSNGLSPNITPHTSFNGTVSATLDLHLPVAIGVGVVIPVVKFDKTISLVDTPGFTVTGTGSNDPAAACVGASVDANFYNNVALDVFDIDTITLATFTTPLFSTCYPLSSSTSAAASTTAASSTAASSTVASSTAAVTGTGVYSSGVYSSGAYSSGVYSSGAYSSGVYGSGAYSSGASGFPVPTASHGPYPIHNGTVTAAPTGGPTATGAVVRKRAGQALW